MNKVKRLGVPTTIGELKKLIEGYGDDVPFGFVHQPIQELVEKVCERSATDCDEVKALYDAHGLIYVSFRQTM